MKKIRLKKFIVVISIFTRTLKKTSILKKIKMTKAFDIQFFLYKNSICFNNETNERLRFCIFKKLKKKIFYLTHDEQTHANF